MTVVDLFSGAGGMSGNGRLQCNTTYRHNIGIDPKRVDLGEVAPADVRDMLGIGGRAVNVLSVCPPCTGFTRTNPRNHLRDDCRNGLVSRAADFAVALDADIVVMENARELIRGNFRHHYRAFRERLEDGGYTVFGRNYMLNRFGLPQVRERAIVIASKAGLPLYTLESMWDGWGVKARAKTVRRALSIASEAKGADHRYPGFASETVKRRIAAIPPDGGSWMDLLGHPDATHLLTGSMKRIAAAGRFGSYPDVYGRMAWDKPAPTIKRECAHIGNGRYAHPEHDRLCTVAEMAVLNGFPHHYKFNGSSLANIYRHIGDAVPPLVSYQLAHLCRWMLTGERPGIEELVLADTSLRLSDLVRDAARRARRTPRSRDTSTTCLPQCVVEVDGLRISLKSTAAANLRVGSLHISKLCEAAWIQDARSASHREGKTKLLFEEYTTVVDAIIQLRLFKRKALYEMVSIPTSVLAQVADTPRTAFAPEGPSIGIPVGQDPPDFTLKLDRSDAKITLANIDKRVCPLLGTWQLQPKGG